MAHPLNRLRPALALAAIALAGCGSSAPSASHSGTAAQSTASAAPGSSSTSSVTSGGASASPAGALSAEVRATGTGDIPDTQQYLTYQDKPSGYQITYPEGWAQKGLGSTVTFQAKNNLIRVVVSKRTPPSAAAVTAQLAVERRRTPSLTHGAASQITLGGATVIKIPYSTISAPNPVTGKRIQLLVDRYVFTHAGKVAILDLATPTGVDNIDAYKRIAKSFQWR